MRPLLVGALWVLAGCATLDDRLRLRALEIEGAEQVDPDDVVARLGLEAEEGWSWSEARYLAPEVFERDVLRVVRAYRALGYYHARVDAVAIRWTPEGEGVVLTFRVTEGPPVRLRTVEVRGLDDLGYALTRELREAVRLEEGGIVTEDDWDATLAGLRRVLRNHGYPAPTVAGRVTVDDVADLADAAIDVDPGPWASFREVRIEGLEDVPEPLVRSEIGIEPGDEYSAEVVDRARNALVRIGVLSSVAIDETLVTGPRAAAEAEAAASVVAEEAAEEDGAAEAGGTSLESPAVVDLDLRLREGSMQRLKIGFGLATEQSRQQVELTGSWEHRNLFGGLRHLIWANRLGWAFNLTDLQDLGPSGSTSLSFRQPSEDDLRLAMVTSLKYEAIPTANDYSTQSVQARVGGEREFRDRTLSLGLHNGVRWVDVWNIAEGANLIDKPYVLYFVDLNLTLDLRDDPLEPREGYYFSALVRAGVDPRGGQYDLDQERDFYRYLLGKADFRGYYRPHEIVTLGLRVAAGLIYPFGHDALAPPDERFFLGGANSVRGFPFHQIGTWRACPTDGTDCVQPPPPGGNLFWNASLELRVDLVAGLSVAAFFDVGNVVDGTFASAYESSQIAAHPTVGAGLRYLTAVGPIRFDIGVPLQDDDRIASYPPVSFHLAFGEAF